ncbi:hypothetical protein LP414_19365 [Polaromonas sp. P1(28)-13]|nr:hypothetical protein LP414_19365 [Polaromonas sp. P1(28)-13]
MSDQVAELHKQHQASQDKYTYFLLAASGACIAFATEKSMGVPLSWHLLLLALAVASWSLSFYYGCKCANIVQALLRANSNLLSLHAGTHENQPQQPELVAAALRGVQSAINKNMGRATQFNSWQFHLFVFGGASFVTWRVFEVIRLAPQP